MRSSKAYYAFLVALLGIVGLGVYAYLTQLSQGLIVTGMRNQVLWGVYIVNFVFFIGISHAGTLISAILRVTNAEWRRPITRMAESITVMAIVFGALMPIIDLGRPERFLNLFLLGRVQSPILWDVLSIGTYLTGSLIYLYLPLIPDIAECRDKLNNASRLKRWLFDTLSLGWRGTEEQKKWLEKAIGIMAVLIIPIAVSVHTVVSWIFGMTLRVGWDSTVFGPYFVVGAIFSGIASIIIAMYLFRRVYHLEHHIRYEHFRNLGMMLLALTIAYIYFAVSEYLTVGYKMQVGHRELLYQIFWGRFSLEFWFFLVGGLVVPAFILTIPRSRTILGITVAAVLVNIGMWLKRWVIVIPSLSVPQMGYEWGTYTPTWVEWSITAAAFAGFALLYAVFSKFFPIVSLWEVREGAHKH